MLHLKLVRRVKGDPLAYVVQCHIKMACVPPGHYAYMNLDEEMVIKANIVDKKSNFKFTQITLDRAYPDHQSDTFRIYNTLVYQFLSKIFICICIHEEKEEYAGWLSSVLCCS